MRLEMSTFPFSFTYLLFIETEKISESEKAIQVSPRNRACHIFTDNFTPHSRLWLPSQKGLFFECLQPHHATVFLASICALTGVNSVPLCEPSQNGWVAERPQAHHQ